MARLEWEKANRDERLRSRDFSAQQGKRITAKRQSAIASFVSKHGLACFACGCTTGEWAKSGISKRGPWVICAPCVKRQAALSRSPIAEA